MSATHNGHLTAITRKTLSTPTRYLHEQNLLTGSVLDYGCGRGSDVQLLRGLLPAQVEGFDPHYCPEMPVGLFHTITCNFVCNVISEASERQTLLENIKAKLVSGGVAYISVRNDRRALKGWTAKGTWQGFVELDLPLIKTTTGFRMYKLVKE